MLCKTGNQARPPESPRECSCRVPNEKVRAFWNEHERHISTSPYGRSMYETMRVWERRLVDDRAGGRLQVRGDLPGRQQGRVLVNFRKGVDGAYEDRAAVRT